ncbi:hypothetical protein KQX54_002652 [Cotesia glomerata]|uniref:Uncharacterized protein n=1 Tax=Cotesia glomerata TaxID=32391 RepID=A0AAV7HRR8_COTGL|nr:hypothetical protein KQX54_002652 [Cotesia glomerata]
MSFIILVIFFGSMVNARFVFLREPKSNDDFLEGYQESKDLDLSFFAGEENEDLIKKISTPENPTMTKEAPIVYNLIRAPSKEEKYQRKLIKLNNSQKGEIILELRVIANNN